MEMLNVKVGVMPGKLSEVVVESGTKVKDIFALADIDVTGFETRLDGVAVDLDKPVFSGALLVAMKKIKGNVDTLKVGVMPGKLEEVVLNPGTTAKEAFELANINIAGYELRLDGAVIDEDVVVNNGNLLVAMKKIKGNVDTIKVGVMPGKLTEIAIVDGTTAKEAFALADIDTSGYELRLDGVIIDEEEIVNKSALLVAMKKIKGNAWENVEPFNYGDLPLAVKEVQELGDMVVLDGRYVVNKEDFEKAYFEVEEHTCTCEHCTCEENDKTEVLEEILSDVYSAIGKLSILALKVEVEIGHK